MGPWQPAVLVTWAELPELEEEQVRQALEESAPDGPPQLQEKWQWSA
jgi:hypothetical protein